MEEIRITIGHCTGEITEKKSRFIASVFEIHSEEEALACLESVRRKYYDAKHNCFAYVLGANNETQRFSDDKEPQGTAGKPILEVLTKQSFRNTLIVVTRYFGGILLGTGGLVRAYTAAAQEGIFNAQQNGQVSLIYHGRQMKLSCDYNMSGKVQYIISQMDIAVQDTIYDARVTYCLLVNSDVSDAFIKKITEATNAASDIIPGEPVAYILSSGQPVLYSL